VDSDASRRDLGATAQRGDEGERALAPEPSGGQPPGARGARPLGAQRSTVGYALVLATLVASFAIQGIAEPGAWEQVLVTCLLGATLLLALRVVQAKVVVVRVALATIVATTSIAVVEAANGIVDGRATRVANLLLVALAPPALVTGVVRDMRARHAVTLDAVFGVLSIYLLLGMLYAATYGAIDRLGGVNFFAQDVAATVSRRLYFSFCTLTTVGYGDLTARTNLGHTLSASEALIGQIYLVTIVSLIVSNLGRRDRPSTAAGST
jgi:hypothetical protein